MGSAGRLDGDRVAEAAEGGGLGGEGVQEVAPGVGSWPPVTSYLMSVARTVARLRRNVKAARSPPTPRRPPRAGVRWAAGGPTSDGERLSAVQPVGMAPCRRVRPVEAVAMVPRKTKKNWRPRRRSVSTTDRACALDGGPRAM